MQTIIDDTMAVLATINLESARVETPPGFDGIAVNLPNDAQAFFIWARIDKYDYAFRLARFWTNDNPFSMLVIPNLSDALVAIREMARH